MAILVCIIGIIVGLIYAIFPNKREKAKKTLKRFSIALVLIIVIFFSLKLCLKYFHGVGEGEKIEGSSTSLFSFSIGRECKPGLKAIGDAIYSKDGVCGYPLCDCYVCTKCGDGVCGKGENHCNCKEDCKESEGIYVELKGPRLNSFGHRGDTLELGGRIEGNWFFEGRLPVKLFDNKGNLISEGIAVARGEWMTDEKVPFDISFPNTNLRSGTLLFSKDNPSGLPQNEQSVSIPFSF